MRVLDLFAGIGGFSLAAHWMGWETVAFVERDDYAQRVLRKNFPGVPIFDDVRNYKGNPGSTDLVCGGFPCQDISAAGKQASIHGERSGLWSEMFRIISEIRPRYIVVENVAALLGRGMDVVLGNLSEIGYDAEWRTFSACEMGFPHARERVFIVAYPQRECGTFRVLDRYCGTVSTGNYGTKEWCKDRFGLEVSSTPDSVLREWNEQLHQSPLVRMVDGFPNVLDRLRCAGNAIVPQIAYEIFRAIEQAEVQPQDVTTMTETPELPERRNETSPYESYPQEGINAEWADHQE